MKKIITLILTAIILFSCVSCFKSDQQYSYSFKTQEEFASIMKKKIDRYDENFDFHFYKWGDNMPEGMYIIAQTSGYAISPIVTFDSIVGYLTNVDEKFGKITIKCFVSGISGFSGEFPAIQDYLVDMVVGGYNLKVYSRSGSPDALAFIAFYVTENYVVKFGSEEPAFNGEDYTVQDFLSYIPEILENKYQLSL